MTEKQAKYLIGLIRQAYASNPAARAQALTELPGIKGNVAVSAMIDALKAVIKATGTDAAAAPASTAVDYVPPLGHYWVDGAHVVLKKSKYKTQTYLYVNDYYYGTVGHSSKAAAYLAEHFPSAEAAYALVLEYSKVTSKCGVCNTKLSDPKSIAAGIGPVCAKKYGK